MTQEQLDQTLLKALQRQPDMACTPMGGAMWFYDNQNESEVMAGCVKDSLPELFWQPSNIHFPGVKHWFAEFNLIIDGEESLTHLAVMCGEMVKGIHGVMIRKVLVNTRDCLALVTE